MKKKGIVAILLAGTMLLGACGPTRIRVGPRQMQEETHRRVRQTAPRAKRMSPRVRLAEAAKA